MTRNVSIVTKAAQKLQSKMSNRLRDFLAKPDSLNRFIVRYKDGEYLLFYIRTVDTAYGNKDTRITLLGLDHVSIGNVYHIPAEILRQDFESSKLTEMHKVGKIRDITLRLYR